jgi:hypothetical protein
MEQLLLLVPGPFSFLDAGVEPVIPPCLALLSRFSDQERGNPAPLVQTVFHHRSFEDLVLSVFPNATFHSKSHLLVIYYNFLKK